MNNFTMKTFADSYLYNTKVTRNAKSDPAKDTNKAIKNFIITSHRIAKDSDAFMGVVEDIKRQQTSAVLLSVLYNSNVILCIGDAPLPRAFTVFDAHDSKSNGAPKVFIDVTGRITYEQGYYYIKRGEVDKICALLFNALIYMLYRYYPNKLVNNTNLALLAGTCYVSMFTNTIDYLGTIGYSENKTKISYLTALFFLNNMMGYELSDYNKNLAGKIAGISPREIKAYDLFIDDDIFNDINIFLFKLIENFRLRGLSLQSFVSQWMRRFGTGMEYGIELYTSFLCMVCSAYTGSYIVNQRQIEMACTSMNMGKLANTILRVGSDCFDLRYSMSESALEEFTTVHSKNTMEMAKSMQLRKQLESSQQMVRDFSSKKDVVNEAKDLDAMFRIAHMESKFPEVISSSICNGIQAAYDKCFDLLEGKEESMYEEGALTGLVEKFSNVTTSRDRDQIISLLNRDAQHLTEVIKESGAPKEIREAIAKTILEFRTIQPYI